MAKWVSALRCVGKLLEPGCAPSGQLAAGVSCLSVTCAFTFKPLHLSRSALVTWPCCSPAPILAKIQVPSSHSLCQTKGGSVFFEAGVFFVFGLVLQVWGFLIV